jgi:anti-anti-sigma factor
MLADTGKRLLAPAAIRIGVVAAPTGRIHDPDIVTRTEGGCTVAVLSGALDITRAPDLREQLLRLLRPATNRLVLDLALVTRVDTSGLAVLVGTARRARLLGGFLRLAAPGAAVVEAVCAAGLDRQFETFPAIRSAVSTPARIGEQSSWPAWQQRQPPCPAGLPTRRAATHPRALTWTRDEPRTRGSAPVRELA